MKFLCEHDFRRMWQCSAIASRWLASVEFSIAARAFLRIGEGMLSSLGAPGTRNRDLIASSSRRRGSVSSVVVTSATLDSVASFLSNLPAKENGLV
jgi:hypothetical protein